MSRAVSPVIGVIIVAALSLFLAAVIGVFVLPPGSAEPTEPAVQNLTTFVGDDDECVLTGTFDPTALDGAGRIVVEIEGGGAVFHHRTDYWRQDISRGANVTVYGVGLPERGGRDGVAVLVDGHFGPECQLVGGETT